ncbi:MAG: hypothetical protein M3480_01470 [Verrucomicrobiota bacterium]|nr:hypothetical protein [Verrucomicrobiota bacterium]
MADQRLEAGQEVDLTLEIAHLLFIDVVGYSKLLVNEQIELMHELNQIVRGTHCFRDAEASERMIRLPTGDGMVLIFFRSPEQPVRCALEISAALRERPRIQVRMGIHSGPVNQVVDVNDQVNVAGAGINIGQRVMDCGDAGHILLSKHVAEDLAQYRHWQPHLHDLGECEVKHGLRLQVFNLHKEGLGNPSIPTKLRRRRWRDGFETLPPISRWPKLASLVALLLSGIALALSVAFLLHRATLTPKQSATPIARDKSIAVLPFENLSADQENAFFTDGVQDEILVDLSKIADLRVISRTSVRQYKTGAKRNLREIATQLGVAHVLEGSVQRSGNRVRVTALLIDARTDLHLWAEVYDKPLDDVFAIQSEIAKAIADQLKAEISPSEKAAIERPPTTDLTAFSLYEQAKALWSDVTGPVPAKENLPKAVDLLDRAVGRDPQFLEGWCLLSRVHGAIYWFGFDRSQARLGLAHHAVRNALQLQPDSGEAHLALAIYYYYGFLRYDAAAGELAIAQRTLVNSAEVLAYISYIKRRQGDWKVSTQTLEHALELDPRNLFMLRQLALSYQAQRLYENETRVLDRVLAIVPGDPEPTIRQAAIKLDSHADVRPFQNTLARLIAKHPTSGAEMDDPDYALCERTMAAAARMLTHYPPDGLSTVYGVNCPRAYWEGVIARWNGDTVKAKAAFTAAREQVERTLQTQPAFTAALSLLAVIDAGLDRREEAVREARQACELLPISKDAVDGVSFRLNLAQVYAWVGEKDLALEQIAELERLPNSLSYGFLKLHPYWDSLRGDPRFETIVRSLAPEELGYRATR